MIEQQLYRDDEVAPWVQFERRAEEDVKASKNSDQTVYKDVDYALITPAYSKDCVNKKVERFFETTKKNVRNGRMPAKWLEHWEAAYKAFQDGEEPPVDGTSIKNWSSISPAQVKMLLGAHIFTIEDLAKCNDEGLRRVGMGGIDLKNKAVAWVNSTKDHGSVVMENAALLKENEQLKISLDNSESKLRAVSAQLESRSHVIQPEIVAQPEAISVADILPKPTIQTTPAEQYFTVFGKKPHHLMKESTMLERIAAK